MEDTGETDHLRSVGRQRKPVGEGQPLLDSVLQRDRKNREKGRWQSRKQRGDGQQTNRNKEVYRQCNWFICETPSGGEITRGREKFRLSRLSVLQKLSVRPRCLHQIFTTCQTNHFVVHYICSWLCIIQKLGVCVCQFFRNQPLTTLRSYGQAETRQINQIGLLDEMMDSSWYSGWLLRRKKKKKTLLTDPQA